MEISSNKKVVLEVLAYIGISLVFSFAIFFILVGAKKKEIPEYDCSNLSEKRLDVKNKYEMGCYMAGGTSRDCQMRSAKSFGCKEIK